MRKNSRQNMVGNLKSNLTLSVILLTVLIQSGCSVHKTQKIELPFNLPDQTTTQADQSSLVDPWWLAFEDQTLNNLMDIAITGNFDLAIAVARIEQLEAQHGMASSARGPSISAAGQIMHDESPGINADSETDQTKAALSASWELDLWSKLKDRQRAALLSVMASRENLKGAMLSISAQVATTYFQLITLQKQLALSRDVTKEKQNILDFAKYRYEQGTGPAAALYIAKEQLAISESAIPVLKNSIAKQERSLSILTGGAPITVCDGIDGRDSTVQLPSLDKFLITSIPSTLLKDRPDVAAALLQLQASDASIGAAIADRFPSLQLSAGVGFSRVETLAGVASGNFWNLLASLSQPIFDGGRRRAEVKRTEAVYRERLSSYYKTVLTAFREVETALDQNGYDEQRYQAKEREVDAANKRLELAEVKYRRGLIDYSDLVFAHLEHIGSQGEELNFQLELIINRITLARSLGGSWIEESISHIQPVVANNEVQ